MSDTTSGTDAPPERMLDLEGAQKWFAERGMIFNTYQMKRMMHTRKLPFRTGPTGRRKFVPESALKKFLEPAG